ncbi:cytochrome P450 [Pseudonocardia spinosispora]|uniref:cytochrome P450 n=1 Tax=Pseudonocardia spinosispora TaxID=103441 RepID=UPI00048C4A6C|nr:cytochrome P450 [Pseudonocardia spinosispora]
MVADLDDDFNPSISPYRASPEKFYEMARGRPVFYSETMGAYLVTRYSDIVAILRDTETFSSSASVPRMYDGPPEVVHVLSRHQVPEEGFIVNESGAEHERSRRAFETALTPSRLRKIMRSVEARAHDAIDQFADREADLVAQYAVPVARAAIDELIGFPDEDAGRVAVWTDDFVTVCNAGAPVGARVDAAHSVAEYTLYIQDLIERRRKHPEDDMISDLIHGTRDNPPISDGKIHSIIRGSARLAGFATSCNAISTTALLMLQNTAARREAAAGSPGVTRTIVEESLRLEAPHRGLFRSVTRPVEFGGASLRAGAMVLLMFGSAGRDEAVFPNADALEFGRKSRPGHLAFGHGLHACPGAAMARGEIATAVRVLFERLPDLRLIHGGEPDWSANPYFRGLDSLPVTW